jgi:hypothetical protein
MREPWHVRVRGPLAAHAVGFREHVVGLGYAPPSVDALRRLRADLSGWLDARGLGLEALVTDEVDEFLREAAIEAAFEGLEMLGAARSTRYDDEYRAQRNARLAAAGYTVIS